MILRAELAPAIPLIGKPGVNLKKPFWNNFDYLLIEYFSLSALKRSSLQK
jgi:hypothetical protein